jgi:C-terminal processing protease CtpA/Prc
LTQKSRFPLQVYEGLLQLEEILDGYPVTDASFVKAANLYGKTHEAHARRLLEGRQSYDAAVRELREILQLAGRKGARLSNDDMFDALDRLDTLAGRAGEGSYLAGQIEGHVDRLETTWSESVLPGVVPWPPESGDGVAVRRVLKGSGAAGAGLKAGHVIVKVDGKNAATIDGLQGLCRGFKQGQQISVTVRSAGKQGTRELRFKLDRAPVVGGRATPEPSEADHDPR